MSDHEQPDDQRFLRAVRRQVERSQRGGPPRFWQSLTTFGTIGWMVALPAVGGAFLGRWLDAHAAMRPFSWTLCLLLLGLALGCAIAWRYIQEVLSE